MRDDLHLFADLYQRNYTALVTFLEDETAFGQIDDLNAVVSIPDQIKLMQEASKRAHDGIKSKTLIDTEGGRSAILWQRMDVLNLRLAQRKRGISGHYQK